MLKNEKIIELLELADQASEGQPIAVDVARCRRAVARRLAARTVGTCVLAGSLVVAGWLFGFRGSEAPRVVEHIEEYRTFNGSLLAQDSQASGGVSPKLEGADSGYSASLTQTVEDTQFEAEMIERTLQMYQERQRLESQLKRVAELEANSPAVAQLRLQEEINLTAVITLDYADRLASEINDPLLAAAEYRRVREHYPGTRWAKEAEKALAQIPLSSN